MMLKKSSITLDDLFASARVGVLYRFLLFIQFATALGSCFALSARETRTGWAQSFALFGACLLLIDVPLDLLLRRFSAPLSAFFGVSFCVWLLSLSSVLALGGNTEDSLEVPINRDEVALGFLIVSWGCHFSKTTSAFAQDSLSRIHEDSRPFTLQVEENPMYRP